MGDGSWSVTLENVEVVRRGDLVLMCRVGQKIVGVPPRRMLSGTTILTVDRGRLILSRETALNLGLISRALHVGLVPAAQHVRAHVGENDLAAVEAVTIC